MGVVAVVDPVFVITASTTHTAGPRSLLLSCVACGVLRMLIVMVVLGLTIDVEDTAVPDVVAAVEFST